MEARIIRSKAAGRAVAAIDSTDRLGRSVSGGSYMLCESGLRLDSSPALPGLTIAIGMSYDPGIAMERVLFGATRKRVELLTAIEDGELAFHLDFLPWNRLIRDLSLRPIRDSLEAVRYACEVVGWMRVHSTRALVDCTTTPLPLTYRPGNGTWHAESSDRDSVVFRSDRIILWPKPGAPE